MLTSKFIFWFHIDTVFSLISGSNYSLVNQIHIFINQTYLTYNICTDVHNVCSKHIHWLLIVHVLFSKLFDNLSLLCLCTQEENNIVKEWYKWHECGLLTLTGWTWAPGWTRTWGVSRAKRRSGEWVMKTIRSGIQQHYPAWTETLTAGVQSSKLNPFIIFIHLYTSLNVNPELYIAELCSM